MKRAEYEAIGHAAAENCLNTILNGKDQAEANRAILVMLNALSGDGEIAAAARRGASVALVNVLERGLEAIRAEVA